MNDAFGGRMAGHPAGPETSGMVLILNGRFPHEIRAAIIPDLCAGVAELVDAPDSKSGSFTGVSVRFRPSVPTWLLPH
jgi:hypothetical protein